MKGFMLLFAAALAGCASSGAVPIGKDTYLITKQSAGGIFVSPSTIKVEVLKEAHEYCAAQNKGFQLVSTNELSAIPAARMPSAEVQFMCLDTKDVEYQRPKMQNAPDRVIEVRQR